MHGCAPPISPPAVKKREISPNARNTQVARPTALKKENIQTRNRKLSTKSKKKRTGIGGFFPPGIDGRFSGYSSGMGMMGSGGESQSIALK